MLIRAFSAAGPNIVDVEGHVLVDGVARLAILTAMRHSRRIVVDKLFEVLIAVVTALTEHARMLLEVHL